MDYTITIPIWIVTGLVDLLTIFLVFFGVTIIVIVARWVVSWVTG